MLASEDGKDDEGWIKVGRGKGHAPQYLDRVDPPARGLTLESLRAEFDSKLRDWRGSSCRKELLSILIAQRPDDGWQLARAVCFATNSFSRDNWQARYRSITQFVVFYDTVQFLQTEQNHSITMSAQEPNYTPLDETFLQSLDVQILEAGRTPASQDAGLGEAAGLIVPSTFIFEPFMDLSTESIHQLFLGDPRLYIGSSMRRWLDLQQRPVAEAKESGKLRSGMYANGRPAGQKMTQFNQAMRFAQSRRSYRFPRYAEDPNILEGLAIYWKEPTE